MSNLNRRAFLAATAAAGVAALSSPLGRATDLRSAPALDAGEMDLVLLNGKIITVSADDAIVEAVAVR